ncbi:MAG TPA: MFS transporter [Acetobacteraceae bacterium]|jgi:MFS transporter, ACS family, tartrate transporter|nr:MFS transporter [Acetobacteraceae bacterium]
MADTLEQVTIRKVTWRLLPFLFLMFIWCLIDRVNLAFAALTMNADLGFTSTMYSLGVSIFFLGYCTFEVPSNLLLERLGARLWLSRIMITWGIISASMAFITGLYGFCTLRVLLGLAEAGFFPGVVLYLTYWFPRAYRARVIAGFLVSVPLTGAFGAPLATSLMQIEGWGLRSWQWLFLLEGIPSVLIGIVSLWYLTDRPSKADWLRPEQRDWLERTIASERDEVEAAHGTFSAWQAMMEPRVLALCIVYIGSGTISYGVAYFLPQIIRGIGLSVFATGFVTAIPAFVGVAGMLTVGWYCDRSTEKRLLCGGVMLIAALGVAGVGWVGSSWWVLLPASLMAFFLEASRPTFWSLPSMFLSRSGAAAGIALINSVGNLGGVIGPLAIGWLRDQTHSFAGGLYFVAATTALAGIVVMLSGPRYVAARQAAF